MATAPENRRTDSIRVRLSPEMMERFETLASRYGMPPATLCAFAVARFVQAEEANTQLSRMAVMEAARKSSSDAVDALVANPNFIDSVLPHVHGLMTAAQVALSQPNLPLDGEASKEGA